MTLDDFEKSLEDARGSRARIDASQNREKSRKHSKHHHKHRHEGSEDHHRHKRPRRSLSRDRERASFHGPNLSRNEDKASKSNSLDSNQAAPTSPEKKHYARHNFEVGEKLERDSWMEAPSTNDLEFIHNGVQKPPEPTPSTSTKADFELKIHANELNKHHLQILADGVDVPSEIVTEGAQHEVDYTFGDAGAQWRMTKLRAVFRQAKETGRSLDDVAVERFGELRAFDDAREEEIELDRRKTYGEGYVRREEPTGELFRERELNTGVRDNDSISNLEEPADNESLPPVVDSMISPAPTVNLDQTALNRLKARLLKAKLRGTSDATSLEAEYNTAVASFVKGKDPEMVVLGVMENRMLSGGRKGEVKAVDSKRGRERGLVEENEDMSIEDMVREERRTRNQAGGDGQRFAERIAKDGKFDNDLDYMDENAAKLAKRVQKSEISLKNTAISDFQKMNRILDKCPLCHKEDTNTLPLAPIVSLATRVYLTLPTEPEISDGGACIIPVQHRGNLLECDDDEWEEIRNFMKSLTRMYHDQGRDVIFYENAAVPQRKKHAGMEAVPLPYSLGETAPAFFKEAILVSDEEWTQHKKLIDTLSKAKEGLGKLAFRRTLVKEMPYFHVWFEIDGGLGHVVEDANRWPKGDLFAREIIGGMLDREPDVIKKQGRWSKGDDRRIKAFRKRWKKFDWTRVLTET